MSVSLELLTDDDILDYTRSDGRDRVLYDHRDISLRGNKPMPVPGGVYDAEAFGSIYTDKCLCGFIRRRTSKEPCPHCGARVFTKEEGLRRFARIELPFYYLQELRFPIFKELFDDIFSECKINYDFVNNDLKKGGYNDGNSRRIGIKAFDMCQFEFNATKKELTVSEFITDEEKCSYEGLIKILEENFPDRVNEFKKLVNRYYIVLPSMMRPFTITRGKDGGILLGTHKMSMWYSHIIRLCCVEDKKDQQELNYRDVMEKLKTPGERVRYTGMMRAYLNAGKKAATGLLNTSKENFARELYSVRTPNSARCPIVPSTTLAIDELGVPTHIAYEMCREGFIKYLMETLNFSEKEAKESTRTESMHPETQKLFKEYAEKQVVLEKFSLVR